MKAGIDKGGGDIPSALVSGRIHAGETHPFGISRAAIGRRVRGPAAGRPQTGVPHHRDDGELLRGSFHKETGREESLCFPVTAARACRAAGEPWRAGVRPGQAGSTGLTGFLLLG